MIQVIPAYSEFTGANTICTRHLVASTTSCNLHLTFACSHTVRMTCYVHT